MNYAALPTEVLALLQQETSKQFCGGTAEAPGEGEPLKILLQCRMYPCKSLNIKSFHGV
jgi:hypothetical protein